MIGQIELGNLGSGERERERVIESKLESLDWSKYLPGGEFWFWDEFSQEFSLMDESFGFSKYSIPRLVIEGALKPFLSYEVRRVADVGCGEFFNMKAWVDEFPEAEIYGYDILGFKIDRAEKMVRRNKLGDRVRVEQKDLRVGSIDRKIDVASLRHPNLYDRGVCVERWREILVNLKSMMKEGGILMMTHYFPQEFEWGQQILEQTEWKKLAAIERPRFMTTRDLGNSDNYVIVAKIGS